MALKNNFKRESEKTEDLILERYNPDFKATVGKGDGVLKTGQLLAYDETDGKYYKYQKGDAKKGIAATMLINDIDTTDSDITTSLFAAGAINKKLVIGLEDDNYKAINELRKYNIYVREVK